MNPKTMLAILTSGLLVDVSRPTKTRKPTGKPTRQRRKQERGIGNVLQHRS